VDAAAIGPEWGGNGNFLVAHLPDDEAA